MNTYIKGRALEDYVEHVYQFLLDLEAHPDDDPVILSRNVRFAKNGYTSEFDIYYEFTKAGLRHKVAIECKNHADPVSIGEVREFYAKLHDLQVIGMMVSNSGFQSGAKTYGAEKEILLLTTEELPSLFQVIAQRLRQVFLPSRHIKGEPFYILMEHAGGMLTGNYHSVTYPGGKNCMLLFLSRKLGLDYLRRTKETDLLVRGLKQEAFDFYILAARRQRATFQVILCETPNGEHAILEIDPDQLKKDYFDYGDTFL
ncbi:MAG: restriction endonuclease [Tannerellaceae bacterium]|nr:restriction endonuclease [Tannerellaceae bacterium]